MVLHCLCGMVGGQAVAVNTGDAVAGVRGNPPSSQRGKGLQTRGTCLAVRDHTGLPARRGRLRVVQRAGPGEHSAGRSTFWRSGRSASHACVTLISRLTLDEGLHHWASIFFISKIDNLTSLRRLK